MTFAEKDVRRATLEEAAQLCDAEEKHWRERAERAEAELFRDSAVARANEAQHLAGELRCLAVLT